MRVLAGLALIGLTACGGNTGPGTEAEKLPLDRFPWLAHEPGLESTGPRFRTDR